jgi:hypothetical protein
MHEVGPLLPQRSVAQHGTSSVCGQRRLSRDMECRCEYTKQAVAGQPTRGGLPASGPGSVLQKVYEGSTETPELGSIEQPGIRGGSYVDLREVGYEDGRLTSTVLNIRFLLP